MDMDNALVIYVLIVLSGRSSLSCELLNCVVQSVKPVAAVRERDLRSDEQQQNREQDFASHTEASERRYPGQRFTSILLASFCDTEPARVPVNRRQNAALRYSSKSTFAMLSTSWRPNFTTSTCSGWTV